MQQSETMGIPAGARFLAARLFSTMLSFAILACPYTCDGGCCAKSEASADNESATNAESKCSGCCRHRAPVDESAESPKPESPQPQSPQRPPSPAAGVNCICAGAIEESDEHSPQCVELYRLLLSPLDARSIEVSIPGFRQFHGDRSNPPNGEWSGRALRTGISSLLC